MFSKRTDFRFDPNPLTRLKLQKIRSGESFIDLTESNPTLIGLRYPGHIFSCFDPFDFSTYIPESAGLLSARREIAENVYSVRGVPVSAEDLVLTAGTSEAYSYLFRLLTEPGDSVLGPVPSYPLFEDLARLDEVRLVPYRWHWEGEWLVDHEELETLFRDHKPRAILVVHPNNPTGHFLREEDWVRITSLCRRFRARIICDEVFFDYRFTSRRVVDPAEESETLCFLLNGLSKIAMAPQLKLGWILLRGPEPLKAECHRRLEVVADTYLSVNTPVQKAAGRILQAARPARAELISRATRNLKNLEDILANSSVTLLPPEGGWNCVLRFPGHRTDEEWALTLLEQTGVLTQPGYLFQFSGPSFLVVSLLPREKDFREGIERIRDLADRD